VRVRDTANRAGSVTGFAPNGDIHRVHNPADRTTISLHIYGSDISRIGSSVRRRVRPTDPGALSRYYIGISRRRP